MIKLSKTLKNNRAATVGLIGLLILILIAAFAPWIAPYDPWDLVGRPFAHPSFDSFILGTDTLGRDVLSGILFGARISLFISLVATIVSAILGVTVGAIAGLCGGKIDTLLMSVTEFFQTIPSFFLAILLVAIFQPSVASIVFAIAIVTWPPIARLTRAEFLALRNREYVLAAISSGRSQLDIALREILPNALPPIIVMSSLGVATSILMESALSFLGLGDPNLISWGYMIGAGRTVIRQAWWISVFPGIAVVATVLAVNTIGQGLNDILDPKQSEG
ncbi:MAG: ABC transporter permease [Rhizobiales bacterium]|nr:ABC transporter permease [Hyphomicrobiales bacterium]